MRYRPEHKAEIHQKIVEDGSRRVRAEGLNGAAVAAVMRDSGLTHGGFYKHFESKEDLIVESLHDAFRDMGDTLVRAAEHSRTDQPWKAMVKTYLSLEYCDQSERGCPLAALAADLARIEGTMKGRIVSELVGYKERLIPYMPGKRTADKERAFFAIFSTMIGATELARMLPEPAIREKVLASARELLLRSFDSINSV